MVALATVLTSIVEKLTVHLMHNIVCAIKKVLIKKDLEQRAAELCRTGYAIKCCVTCKPLKFIFDINSTRTA